MNNDAAATSENDPDPELRTQAEVIAIVEYLLAQAGADWPEPPWERIDGNAARTAAAERGRELFDTLGCLGCHACLSHRPTAPDGQPREPIGATWIIEDLATRAEQQADDDLTDEEADAIWERAEQQYERMTDVDRVTYALQRFPSDHATLFQSTRQAGPVLTRFGTRAVERRIAIRGRA